MTAAKHDKVAKRYARALFEVCQPTEFDATAAQLKALASLWSGSPEFRQSMLNPSVQDNTRAEIVDSLVKSISSVNGVSGWANRPTERTVQTLVGLRKAAIFPAVSEFFSTLVNEYRKSLTLSVSVANPVTPEVISDVKARLSQSLGGEVTVSVKHDPSLLGGMTIRLGDRLLDRSVAGTLQRLASQLA